MDNQNTTTVMYSEIKYGVNIKRYRKSRGMTIESLAEQIGVTPRFVSQLESGERLGSVRTLIDIATTLQVTLESLLS